MKKLIELSHKQTKNVIGLMSGTSLNGVDAALVEIENSGTESKINLKGYIEYPFPKGLKELILQNSAPETSRVDDICRLNFLLPHLYADAIKELCRTIDFDLSAIDLIGSHGQTIHHLPQKEKMFGYDIGSTLQIGEPSVIAKLTGAVTVGNFRTGDVALGGQGAPLVPYFDYIIFHSNEVNRLLLNVGGIANLTILDKFGTQNDILAFDTGPGNMLLDAAVKKFFDKEFDPDGEIGMTGKFNEDLFNAFLARDRYIESKPPKSTGRELYGEEFIGSLYQEFADIDGADWLRTIAKLTAYGVFRNYKKYVEHETKIDEIIVSGGGARNKCILSCLREYFGERIDVKVIDEIGISADAKEAICFAVLANETISGNPANIPRTTGASAETILGKICLP